jgi:hypothetical protein
VYPIVALALGIFLFGVMGGISFGPKYMENQFNIPTWQANIILGKIFIANTLNIAFGISEIINLYILYTMYVCLPHAYMYD